MFWDNLCVACHNKKITPTALSKELSISSSSVTAWKQGRIPNGETLIKIANYLQVSIDYLLGRTDEPTQITGHINGDNSIQTIQDSPVINHQALTEYKQDSVTSEFIKIFEDLNFDDKVELMGLAVKMRKEV